MGDPITLSFLAVSTALQYNESRKRARAAREEGRVSQAVDKAEAIRQTRMESRKARIRRAQIEQAAENTGVGQSSGQAGALAAISQNQFSQQSYFAGQELAVNGISQQRQDRADSMFRSQVIGGVTNLFMAAYQPTPKE